jgi:hypothetical protein
MKVRELIALLSQVNQDAEVRTKAENAMSRSPMRPQDSEGYKSSYLQVLPEGYSGFKEAKDRGETFPVVWL